MPRVSIDVEQGQVSELAIVDTFTKLIFGEEDDYSAGELNIIDALRMAEASVLSDSHEEMGEYLRGMGVGEMVLLVSLVREHLLRNLSLAPIKTIRSKSKVGHPTAMR